MKKADCQTMNLKLNTILLSLGFALYFPGNPIFGQKTEEAKKPNIVLLYADDLGYGDLSCYGNKLIQTPNLDKMASEGMRFTDFYAPAPICSPSRAGLLTGRYPIQMGIQQVFFPESWTGLPPTETLIPEALKSSGYVSGLIGKWHLGHHAPYLPTSQGFDSYFGVPYSNDMAGLIYMRDSEPLSDKVDQKYSTQVFTAEAGNFIKKHAEKPFFLMVAYTMPHVPLHASEGFAGKSKGGLYGDCVEELDWSAGKLIQLIDSLGLSENTLLLFTSDNGPWLVFGKDGGSAGPLKGGKQFATEGGMRVPLIARWKAKIPEGKINPSVSSQLDFFPTFLDLAGKNLGEWPRIRGGSMKKQLLQNEAETKRSLAYFSQGKLQAYRSGDWKLFMPYSGNPKSWYRQEMAAHDTLLFNLKNDPGEMVNLFEKEKQRVDEIRKEVEIFLQKMGPNPSLIETKRDPDLSHQKRQREDK
jgi:arylsulfatase A